LVVIICTTGDEDRNEHLCREKNGYPGSYTGSDSFNIFNGITSHDVIQRQNIIVVLSSLVIKS